MQGYQENLGMPQVDPSMAFDTMRIPMTGALPMMSDEELLGLFWSLTRQGFFDGHFDFSLSGTTSSEDIDSTQPGPPTAMVDFNGPYPNLSHARSFQGSHNLSITESSPSTYSANPGQLEQWQHGDASQGQVHPPAFQNWASGMGRSVQPHTPQYVADGRVQKRGSPTSSFRPQSKGQGGVAGMPTLEHMRMSVPDAAAKRQAAKRSRGAGPSQQSSISQSSPASLPTGPPQQVPYAHVPNGFAATAASSQGSVQSLVIAAGSALPPPTPSPESVTETARNRKGQEPGYPQARKMHMRNCCPEEICKEDCPLRIDFPERHADLARSTERVFVNGVKVPVLGLWAMKYRNHQDRKPQPQKKKKTTNEQAELS